MGNRITAFYVLALALPQAACKDAPASTDPPIAPTDGRDGLSGEVARQVAALDPKIDSDGDGLADVDELAGWTIRVNSSGRDQGLVARFVTSDPDDADSDGDDLSDGVERMVGSDPNATDTDGDGLSDRDEVERWGTSPATVDSDDDARGKDPDPSGAPDVTLFDGAELKLEHDPADPDGPLVPGAEATNPLQGDTDGDGVWDWDEAATPTRSTVIAELPILRVQPSAGSTIGLWLDVVETGASGHSSVRGTELSWGAGSSFVTHNSLESVVETWIDGSVKEGATRGAGVDLDHLGGQVGIHAALEAGIGITSTIASELSLSGTLSTSFEQIAETTKSDVEEHAITVESGRIVISVDIVNVGLVPCKVSDLSVLVAFRDAPFGGLLRPVAALHPKDAGAELVLGRDEVVPVQLVADDIAGDRVLALMASPSQIVLMPVHYEITTAGDASYTFIEADVRDRTATVDIDFGTTHQSYAVAAQVYRDANGTPIGRSLSSVLDLAGIAWNADPVADPQGAQAYIYKIGDVSTELYSDAAPELGDPLPYPSDLAPGPRLIRRGWYALVARRSGVFEFADQLEGVRLLPGDRVALMLMEDEDRDGVPAPEEFARGTKDSATDSDGDGLSDWWEMRVGWDVRVAGRPAAHVVPNPASADSDHDTLGDKDELLRGTNPWLADSDGDGVSDPQEIEQGRDPLTYDGVAPVIADCGTLDVGPVTNHDRPVPYVAVRTVHVTDRDGDLATVTVRWQDGVSTTLPMYPTSDYVARLGRAAAPASVLARDT
ncbi:MAG: hypothetical protein U1F43_37955, partial [Myxococcota bacterium]